MKFEDITSALQWALEVDILNELSPYQASTHAWKTLEWLHIKLRQLQQIHKVKKVVDKVEIDKQ